MNTRSFRLLATIFTLSLGLIRPAAAADPATSSKPGYTVILDLKVDENGVPEDAKIFHSDDTTIDHILDRTAMAKARALKLAPRLKEGVAVKYSVRAPFVFPVEGDEGPESNNLISRPKILQAAQPVYPAALATAGECGSAILEVVIDSAGRISSVKELRSTHPAFAQAATDAVRQWTLTPAQQQGKPVESRWRLSLCFETDVRTNDWVWRVAPRPSLGNYTVIHQTQPLTAPAAQVKPPGAPEGQ